MSTSQGAYDGSQGYAPWGQGCATARWTPFELVAMVLGFIVFWPIGLAILGYKYWQRKNGGPDLQTVASGAFSRARSAFNAVRANSPRGPAPSWTSGFTTATGNAAFDEWKRSEIARLEAERRKLEDAHREFAEWLDAVRRSKDREEFDRFMNERRAGNPGA